MKYIEAVKKVKASTTKDNFMLVEFGYNSKIIIPYKDGLVLMSSLGNAEKLDEPYGKPKQIMGIEREAIKCTPMSNFEYTRIKIANLLNVGVDELDALENPQPETETTP